MTSQSVDNPRKALAVLDPDVNVGAIHQADLSRIEAALEKLADGLSPEDAALEIEMRGELIAVERRLFPGRLERARIMLRYQALYQPQRKFARFLKAVNIAHQTAYDLIAIAEAEITGPTNCTESVQSTPTEDNCVPPKYGFDLAVDKACKSLLRIFHGLDLVQRQQALAAVSDRIAAAGDDRGQDRAS